MKIICSRTELVKSLNISLRAVPVKTTIPVLECVLIRAEENRITFTTNDMELGIETEVAGLIEEEGMVAIDAKMFSEIIRKLTDDDVVIRTDEHFVVTILCGKAKFNIAGREGDDFTALPEIEKEDRITVFQRTLRQLILQTIFATAPNENNKLMGGELFQISGPLLKVVSLDGHRVAIRRVELKEMYGDKKVVVPGKTLNEISKILNGDNEDEVDIFFMKNHIVFELENTTIVSSIIEGEYFNVDRMLSSDYETKIRVNRTVLLNCLERSMLFVREGFKKPIIMDIRDGYMKLDIDSMLGSMDEDIDISKEGKDIFIGFNPKFLIDALRAIEDEEVTVYLQNSKSPCSIRDAEENYTYIVLPVNFTR